MKTRNSHIIIFLLALLTLSCKPAAITKSTSQTSKETYVEDLSRYRPEVPQNPPSNVDQQVIESNPTEPVVSVTPVDESISVLIDSIASLQLVNNKIQGFTILVHTGNNREEAIRIRGMLLNNMPEVPSELIYQQPFFKVKLGRFSKQILAEALLEKVRIDFPSAIIIPDTFPVVSRKNE